MIDAHMTPDLAVNALRLLLEGYKVFRDRFKDKSTPDRVEQILVEAEKTPEKATEIGDSLTKTLEPSDAAMVKGDLELLSLLLVPAPNLDAFDYWSRLTKLVAGLQAFAVRNRLFELRGQRDSIFGDALELPTSGDAILPDNRAVELAVPDGPRQRVRSANTLALLLKDTKVFPLVVFVRASFNEYHSIGGPPSVLSDVSYFSISAGPKTHWLRFDRKGGSYHFETAHEYMLEASDFIAIVRALRQDVQELIALVHADEEKIRPLFAAIEAFSLEMNK